MHSLPDGQRLDVAPFSRAILEKLLVGAGRVSTLLAESVKACGEQSIKDAIGSNILTGGSSNFVNLNTRVESALVGSSVGVGLLPLPFAHRARSLFDVTSMVDILEHIQLDKLCQKTHANYVQTKEHLEHGIAGDRTVLMNLREGYFRKEGTVSFDQQPAILRLSPQEAGRALQNVVIGRCVAVEVRTNVGKISKYVVWLPSG